MNRRPNASAALTDFVFAGGAFIGGCVGAPVPVAMLMGLGAVAAWWWTRRRALAAMAPSRRYSQGAVAIAMIAAVLALAYWIGLLLGGHT